MSPEFIKGFGYGSAITVTLLGLMVFIKWIIIEIKTNIKKHSKRNSIDRINRFKHRIDMMHSKSVR